MTQSIRARMSFRGNEVDYYYWGFPMRLCS